ncbi:MAG: GNAT family N-acetyltransferase [Hapalosiphonaceae cyanobacterium JJU2]|nr:MAG: GNAT family N-acetyltransferase [Hapalosiphonaceae cyanobacterium JJU2]
MTSVYEYSKLANAEDVKRLGEILGQCFIGTLEDQESYINIIGADNFRILHQKEQIAGGLAILPMGQWWGSQRVPMGGIAAVGIAPEYRGTGAAITMIQQTLKELHTRSVPISVLYPATQRLYRKAGYEQAGSFCTWEIACETIPTTKQPLPVIRVEFEMKVLDELYQQKARLINGHLDRYQAIWDRLGEPDEKETVYTYLIGSANQPEGYIIFSQHRTEEGSILRIKDWVLLTNAALQSFWNFIASHRSQIDKLRWRSSIIDDLGLGLPEQTAKIKSTMRWMLRVIDVVKALEMRGYPPGIEAELHLEIQDDLFAENNGKFVLAVSNGRGEVTSGGKGELQLEIKGLAPLYTSLFTPQQLQLAGKLTATESALLAATQIFTNPSPWTPDFF